MKMVKLFLYFPEQFVLKNVKPTRTVHCRIMCWEIAHGGRYYFVRENGTCHCDFCPRDLINLLLSPKRMSYFLEYTGCEDIFSLKKHVDGVVHCWFLQILYFIFCSMWPLKWSLFYCNKLNGISIMRLSAQQSGVSDSLCA